MFYNNAMMKFLQLSNLGKISTPAVMQVAGIKNFLPPKEYSDVELPENERSRKLPILPRIPPLPGMNVRPPKMIKNLRFMKGAEEIHNKLIHKQYGIIALTGGRLKYNHFDMMRMTLNRKIDSKRMFLVYRVDTPWQPVTKKGQGMRMGGGKGAIDHYVTPIRANRVILELAGKCDWEEVKGMLHQVAHILPFNAMAVNQEMLEERIATEKLNDARNLNEYTMEYIIKNNMGFAKRWARRTDYTYFGKYI